MLNCKLLLIVIITLKASNIQCQNLTVRIVGGSPTNIANLPYQAAVIYNRQLSCGGSIIAPKWILTAAHCVLGFAVNNFRIRIGSSKYANGGFIARAQKTFYNRNYNRNTFANDIGLIKLRGSLQSYFGSTIRVVNLPEQNANSPQTATISGWGRTSSNSNPSQNLLRATVTVFDNAYCSRNVGSAFQGNLMLCAGRVGGGVDSCQGDSGGGLTNNNIVYGVVSFGDGCGRAGNPGVYTKVSNYRTWINTVLANNP